MTVDNLKYCTEEAADWLYDSLSAVCRLSLTAECRTQVKLWQNQLEMAQRVEHIYQFDQLTSSFTADFFFFL